MSLRLYNTLAGKIEEFKPISDKKVGLYICGPTVYDFAHLGNLRTYIFEDILRRVLEYDGYQVKQVVNITDVDDKSIKRSREEGVELGELTSKYEKAFFEDLEKLNIKKADFYPKATEHINEMSKLISKLLDKGFAYQASDGIYFAIGKFKDYGKLSRLSQREIKIGARVVTDQYDKENAQDFALWKFPSASLGQVEPSWDVPFGRGRPGWHIECSAMSMKYLGEHFDIHTGGVDLIFPHHENEIAQSEAVTGKKFVNWWLEGEHLLVSGQKMAKSLGNFYTLRDLENKGFDPLAFRYLVLTAHWQKKLDFSWESLKAAQNALSNLKAEVASWDDLNRLDESCLEFENGFKKTIENNLDTPAAIAVMWKLVKSNFPASAKRKSLLEMDAVLGLRLDKVKETRLPSKAQKLIEKREEARKAGDFDKADEIRQQLKKMGIEVEDTPAGPKWKLRG